MKTAKFLLRAAVILSALTFLLASSVFASHFRYGHLTWKPRPDISPTTVEFTLTNAFRRSGYGGSGGDGMPIPGDVITEFVGATSLIFGDATSTSTLQYRVIGTDVGADWLNAVALDPSSGLPGILHTYPSAGPWTAEINSCCRIGNLANASNAAYRVLTIVETGSGNSSPVSSLPPIVTLQEGGVRTFFVPGADANGDGLSWRLATIAECFIPNQPAPPEAPNALSVDAGTGLATWNTTGLAVGGLWACQVVVAEQSAPLRGNGAIGPATQVGVDFIIEIVPAGANNTPAFDHPASPACNTIFVVNSGDVVNFTVQASDPDVGDVVTINSPGLPAGSDMTPALPESGNPVSSAFSWTPGPGDAGVHVVTFTATDQDGAQVLCSYTIRVNARSCIDTLLCGPDSIYFSYHLEDPNGGPLLFNCNNDPPALLRSPYDTTICIPIDTAGYYELICTVIDSCGATATDKVCIQVRFDEQPPKIACPANIVVDNDPGFCQAEVSYPPPQTGDNCPGQVTVVCAPPSGSAFPVGTTTVKCIATDASGNKDSCTFTITVRDTTLPVVVCPADITVSGVQNGQVCEATVNYPAPQTSDNCAGPVTVVCLPASGSVFPVGTTTVTCTATDAAGNEASCSFAVTVIDCGTCTAFIPPPVIKAVEDVGNDQGYQVRVTWCRSIHDNIAGSVFEYLLYRRIDPLPVPVLGRSSAGFSGADFPPGQWDYITSAPAVDQDLYNMVVATLENLGDQNPIPDCYSTFFIRASNQDRTVFFDSDPLAGYSVDNIAPAAPTVLAAKPDQGKMDLTWHAVPDRDFREYRVYRDTSNLFGTAAMLGKTTVTNFEDASPILGMRLFYRVTATDSSGNEGLPSVPASAAIGMKGDLNFDGDVTPADIVLLMNCLFSASGACPLNVADGNCDGVLTPSDLVLILMRALNGIDFPC